MKKEKSKSCLNCFYLKIFNQWQNLRCSKNAWRDCGFWINKEIIKLSPEEKESLNIKKRKIFEEANYCDFYSAMDD